MDSAASRGGRRCPFFPENKHKKSGRERDGIGSRSGGNPPQGKGRNAEEAIGDEWNAAWKTRSHVVGPSVRLRHGREVSRVEREEGRRRKTLPGWILLIVGWAFTVESTDYVRKSPA